MPETPPTIAPAGTPASTPAAQPALTSAGLPAGAAIMVWDDEQARSVADTLCAVVTGLDESPLVAPGYTATADQLIAEAFERLCLAEQHATARVQQTVDEVQRTVVATGTEVRYADAIMRRHGVVRRP